MPKPCRLYPDDPHTAPRPGCRLCELAATRGDYARLWGEPAPNGATPAAPAAACPHLGEPTGETVPCRTCKRADPVLLPVRRCGLHGRTVTGDRAPASDEITACRWCPDRPR